MTTNGNVFRVSGLCEGNPPVTGGFPAQWPVTRSFDVFFDLRLNKRFRKQPVFKTSSRSLWRHCGDQQYLNDISLIHGCCTNVDQLLSPGVITAYTINPNFITILLSMGRCFSHVINCYCQSLYSNSSTMPCIWIELLQLVEANFLIEITNGNSSV